MTANRSLAFLLMDAPYESARTSMAFRLLNAAIEKRFNVNVFAYEGAAALSFAKQTAHANPIHGRDANLENHPLPRIWIEQLFRSADQHGVQLQWVNCGLCVDERGVNEFVQGARRGSPADFWRMSQESRNTLIIATR